MRLALKSALMLTTRVIQIINPELQLHMQRTALIALELSLALNCRGAAADHILRRAASRYWRARR
jgi:hypothetical protein